METQNVFDYIITEQNNYKTLRVTITDSKDWNMAEHIERCTNVSQGWYHKGKNDGQRPYKDIVTPIVNVALRSEGFDVKDIVPFVDNADESYKSFLVKKYHPKWARKYELDTFIDEVVESSVIYDLALIKDIGGIRPERIPLQQIAFCDQTDIMSGPICLRHEYTPAQLVEFKGKWDNEAIDNAITLSVGEKTQGNRNKKKVKTPGKYIEVFELRGNMPEYWLNDEGELYKYVPQMHVVCFYTNSDGDKCGITLYKGKDKPLDEVYKSLVLNPVFGRACGKSIVETLFDPQVWANYSGIKIKEMLDSVVNLFQTDSEEFGNQKLSELPNNTILKHEPGKPITKVQSDIRDLTAFTNYQATMENDARILGSASDAQLGTNPVSGTPFALQQLVVQQGQGIHEFRQGKIATFFADVLYRDWILKMLVKEMNNGVEFSEELSLDEMQEIVDDIVANEVEEEIAKQIKTTGNVPTNEDKATMIAIKKEAFLKKGNRKFFEVFKGEMDEIPVDVYVNIKGKQRYMAQNADKITNVIREVIRNPQAFTQIPGIGKAFNQLLEESGMSPINFSPLITAVEEQPVKSSALGDITKAVGGVPLQEQQATA